MNKPTEKLSKKPMKERVIDSLQRMLKKLQAKKHNIRVELMVRGIIKPKWKDGKQR